MDSALHKEVKNVFRDSGLILDDKLLAECVSICQMYGLDAESLRFKLEAVNYKATTTASEISRITIETLEVVKRQIQASLNKDTVKKAQINPKSFVTAQVNRSRLPPHMLRSLGASMGPTAVQVKQEAGDLGAHTLSSTIATSNVVFSGPPVNPEAKRKRAYRYMYEKISERSEALDDIIQDFADLVGAHYGISNEFGDPAAVTDEEVYVVGRITHDIDTTSGAKLAENSIFIESSRYISSGSRVALRFDPAVRLRGFVRGVGGTGIYPGAVVALKGKNGGGEYFFATEILAIPPLKSSPQAQGVMNPKMDPLSGKMPASMMVISGPFTVDADLGYRPWRTLLQQIKITKPDVLLLIGPFVDSTHPKIKTGDADVTPANLFKVHFQDTLKSFLTASPTSMVLIVPSVKDLLSGHAVYPQPEFDAGLFAYHPRIHLLPNPCRFTINEISFAVTSVDTLFHLRKEEYFKRGVEFESLPAEPNDLPSDGMANLCRHLLLQRSFYPIFPTPPDLAHEVNLDMSHSEALSLVDSDIELDYAPDVLIVPSRLKQFSKVVHSMTAINPSFLSKGSYAMVSLAALDAGKPVDRIKVEISKLEQPTTATTAPAATSTMAQ
ncbi:DNA polymerase alpha/epsilon subunit B-domain-containing protein [Panaeolus papilionaceus]|nr:DNA polymerase alpha/epsilon subunit B-domain-containing protein [Panaeolus papilionaceus]